MRSLTLSCLTLAACFALASTTRAADDGDAAAYQKLVDQKSPAIVTIKCVLKLKASGVDREMESENSGVMIDEKGLVLCSNSRLGGALTFVTRMMGGNMSGVSITPTDIKVIVGDAAEGVDAKFVARDTELDLAWIQIKEPGDKKFAFIDLTKSATPKLGQRIISIYRTSKFYDRAPSIVETMINTVVRKPRELYLAAELDPALGLPAFTADGKVAGVSVLQLPDTEDESNAQMARINRMAHSNEFSGALLPAAEVVKATARAKETAASQPADEESESKPASDESEDTSKKKPEKKNADGEEESKEEK